MTLTNCERFKAIVNFERPDYVPIFGFPGAGGMSDVPLANIRHRLVEQGMPEWVGADGSAFQSLPNKSWQRYWGTTSPAFPPISLAEPSPGLRSEKSVEGDFEVIEWETGASTRQILDNDRTYIMPEFLRYHVRDRVSWEYYRERTTPRGMKTASDIETAFAAFNPGDHPVAVHAGTTWGGVRNLMGPAAACTILYDDPDLARDIIAAGQRDFESYTVPLIERLRPDILIVWEDSCYNHGMFISPQHFREFCAPYYRRVCEVARDCGVDMVGMDSDGNVMELVPLVEECGLNAMYPFEPKGGNDLFALRERHPRFLLMGWLEKEVVNEGNDGLIRDEILSKAPTLLQLGGYFPNLEHAIQPMATFENLCRFMTLLHEVTGNPEGEFPRMNP